MLPPALGKAAGAWEALTSNRGEAEGCGEEAEIIYSFGGRAPWLHSALKTKHGYIVYGKGFMTQAEFKGYHEEYQKDLGKAIVMSKNLRKIVFKG